MGNARRRGNSLCPITPIPYEGRSPRNGGKELDQHTVRTAGGDGKSEITQERRTSGYDTGIAPERATGINGCQYHSITASRSIGVVGCESYTRSSVPKIPLVISEIAGDGRERKGVII